MTNEKMLRIDARDLGKSGLFGVTIFNLLLKQLLYYAFDALILASEGCPGSPVLLTVEL